MDSRSGAGPIDRLYDFVKERFPMAMEQDLRPDSPLLSTGIIDSLGILDLVAFLESEFGIRAEDTDLIPENFETIESLARFVQERR